MVLAGCQNILVFSVYSVSHGALWCDLLSELLKAKNQSQLAIVIGKIGGKQGKYFCSELSKFNVIAAENSRFVDTDSHHPNLTQCNFYLPQRMRLFRPCSYPFSRQSRWPPYR